MAEVVGVSRMATLVFVNRPSPDAINPKPTVPLPLLTTQFVPPVVVPGTLPPVRLLGQRNNSYPPNPTIWDCGNGSHNKGLSTARSRPPSGVSLLLCDGSVRLIGTQIQIAAWRAISARGDGELVNDP